MAHVTQPRSSTDQGYVASTFGTGTILLPVNGAPWVKATDAPFTIGFWVQLHSYPGPDPDPYPGQLTYAALLHAFNDLIVTVTNEGGLALWVPYNDTGGFHERYPQTAGGVLSLMEFHWLEIRVSPGSVGVTIDGDEVALDTPDGPTDGAYFPIALGSIIPTGSPPKWGIPPADVDITQFRMWRSAHDADHALIDQYSLPESPDADADLLVDVDLSQAAPVVRKSSGLPLGELSLSGGAAMQSLGVACDESALIAASYGTYTCARRTPDGTWAPDAQTLEIGQDGTVSYGGTAIQHVILDCDGIHWPAADNPFAGSLWMWGSSDDDRFWPEEPPPGPCLEGIISAAGADTAQLFRGMRHPRYTEPYRLVAAHSGTFLSANASGAVAMAALNLSDSAQEWVTSDSGATVNQSTGQVLTAPAAVSGALTTAPWAAAETQMWISQGPWLSPESAPDLRAQEQPDGSVILQPAGSGSDQAWLLTSTPVQFQDPAGRVLVNTGSGVMASTPPSDPLAGQWLLAGDLVLSAKDGQALGVATDAPAAGASVTLQNPGDAPSWTAGVSSLAFELAPTLLLTADSAGNVTLQSGSQPGQEWTAVLVSPGFSTQNPPPPASDAGLGSGGLSPASSGELEDGRTYVVRIQTSDEWLAGTGSGARMMIMDSGGTWKTFAADSSFDAGSSVNWTVSGDGLNGTQIHGVALRAGGGLAPDWRVDFVEVYDPSLGTVARFGFDRWMKSGQWWAFGAGPMITAVARPVTAAFYPAQFATITCTSPVRVLSHTYVTLQDTDSHTVYFDCAGGHTPCPGDTPTVALQTFAVVTDMVRMAMGQDLSPTNPLKNEYGQNDVAGVETCGLVAAGFRQRDGLCHQIANRLMYAASPRVSLSDLPLAARPGGYTIPALYWGEYGTGFAQWCANHNFAAPPSLYNQRRNVLRQLTPTARQNVLDAIIVQFGVYAGRYIDISDYMPEGAGMRAIHDDFVQRNESSYKLPSGQVEAIFKDEL